MAGQVAESRRGMANTRREFLQSSAALAVGVVSGAQMALGAQAHSQPGTAPLPPAAAQIPKMKFGSAQISRLVLGVNPMYGFSHFNSDYSSAMRDWYTEDKVCEVLHRANSYGINAFNYVNMGRAPEDLARFEAEGGRMHLIIQVTAKDDAAALVRDLKPLALQRRGEEIDAAFQHGTMADEREWCKRARDLGVMVGVGTHKPEVIDLVEAQGWDIDFYAGCVYNRTRTADEWKQTLNGQMMEMPHDIYMQSDPARMYKAIRQTPKPCFAFKILAAGRIADDGVAQAFRTAYAGIKPNDGVYVGVFPRRKDELKENTELVHSILTAG
jgi:thiamine monophosphate synthase